ncbi:MULTISPECIES: hypothetical protein [Methylobacterium]|uniref:hypothetical protein n=1 Tax=Methylobacterium TaxID=407 RepID=UPI001FED708D|nr:hypothetical protein [Methylobacterium sp. DB0501]
MTASWSGTGRPHARCRRPRASISCGIRPLARALGRDVRRGRADGVALTELGFVARAADGGLSSEADGVATTIRIAA